MVKDLVASFLPVCRSVGIFIAYLRCRNVFFRSDSYDISKESQGQKDQQKGFYTEGVMLRLGSY